MTYLVATTEVIYSEEALIKMMLDTGEYGIHGYPISHEAMVEFVKDQEWQIAVSYTHLTLPTKRIV